VTAASPFRGPRSGRLRGPVRAGPWVEPIRTGGVDRSDTKDARPIWSPTRPNSVQQAGEESASSTLRLVRDGWGQSRPETVTSSNPNAALAKSHSRRGGRGSRRGLDPADPANWQGVIDSPSTVQEPSLISNRGMLFRTRSATGRRQTMIRVSSLA
jgi:hypothetical protein